MLENFQLAAIVRRGGQARLLKIPLHQDLQDTLAASWGEQYGVFRQDIEEVAFNPGYTPEDNERFVLEEYPLPDWLDGQSSLTVHALDSIGDHEEVIESIRGIVGFAQDDDGEEVVLFQNFSRSHVIQPGRFLLLQNDTYESTQRPGLRLDGKLSAVFEVAQNKLLFLNFRTVNTFLPITDFYEDASEEEILEILGHDLLAPEDAEAMAVGAKQWYSKRFAMLRDSGILDKYSAKQIKAQSKGYDVDIQIKGGKIVFPADKAAAKKLLQFLNEEIFRGAITETLYETNSKREAD